MELLILLFAIIGFFSVMGYFDAKSKFENRTDASYPEKSEHDHSFDNDEDDWYSDPMYSWWIGNIYHNFPSDEDDNMSSSIGLDSDDDITTTSSLFDDEFNSYDASTDDFGAGSSIDDPFDSFSNTSSFDDDW